eukprot:g4809.t1
MESLQKEDIDGAWVDAVHPVSRTLFFGNLITGERSTVIPSCFTLSEASKTQNRQEKRLRLLMNAFYLNLPRSPKRRDISLQLAKLSDIASSVASTKLDLSDSFIGPSGAQCVAWTMLNQTDANRSSKIINSALNGEEKENESKRNWYDKLLALGIDSRENCRVEQLDLSNCSLEAVEISDVNKLRLLMFAMKRQKVLSRANLSYNALGPLGGSLASFLLSGNTTLHSLTMKGCELGNEGVLELAQALKGLSGSGLVYLDISECGISDLGMVVFSRAFATNRNLLELNIARNSFGPIGLRAIGIALRLNDTLDSLWLDGNDLTGRLLLLSKDEKLSNFSGLETLFNIRSSGTLRMISMENTHVGIEGISRIVPLLFKNTSLRALNFRGCHLGDKGIVMIQNLLRRNSVIHVAVGQNKVNAIGEKRIKF